MKLTNEQYKNLTDYLEKMWQPPTTCPVCRSNNWDVSREIYELRQLQGGLGSVGIAPVCPVTCGTCGNTVLINALVAGIDLNGTPHG